MSVVLVLICFCISFAAGGNRVVFGRGACKTLCPVVNCTDNDALSEGMLRKSDRGFPLSPSFEFASKIRRTTPFRVNMTSLNGLHTNSLMLVFRESQSVEGSPLGYFVDWSDNLQDVRCDNGPPNALTNKDLSAKSSFWFTWMPPDISDINVAFRGTFVMDDEYWHNIEVKSNFIVDTFPPSTAECNKKKSCVTVSQTAVKCDRPSHCDLTVNYGLTNGNHTLAVTLGGKARETGDYVAVGFTDDHATVKGARIFSCKRTVESATVQYFEVDNDGTLVERGRVLEDTDSEQDGEIIWCSFKTPVNVAGHNLATPLYQMYLHGKSNAASGVIEIGSKYATSKERMEIGVPVHSALTSSASSLEPLYQIYAMFMLQLCLWLQHIK